MTPRAKASDVAKRAGVSQTAVSFVMNGQDEGNVSTATRERILQAAADLGYEPNEVARSLRQRRTRTLGVVTDAIATSPFAGRLMAGAQERAATQGYAVVTIDCHDHPEREAEALAELARRRVDGLIYASMGFRVLPQHPTARIPVVLANCTARTTSESSVVPDDAGGAISAARHLLDLGHRDLVMLTGPGDDVQGGNVSGPIRAQAFAATARSAGARVRVVEAGWAINDGYAAASDLLAGPDRPSAIFAVTDRSAVGVLLAAAQAGLRVPDDVSVMGFDDEERLASDVVPSLTTIALPHVRMGEVAVEMALEAAGGTLSPRQDVLPCPLVVRASTASPR